MLTDIEIAQNASLLPITQVAQRLGISEEELEPYGRFKAKLSPAIMKRLAGKADGKLILVTAINPTPAGEGKTTTTVGLGEAMAKLHKTRLSLCASLLSAPFSALRAERPAADTRRPCPWRTSTFISPATCMPSPLRTTCYAHASIIIFSRAIHSASTRAASFLSAAWI